MKPFGSGYFGEWIADERGLPAFRYDCDHLTDPAAISPTNAVWRKGNDHSFQFGNDRITCLASNFGTVQVRQDEGAPKFLGDIDPEDHCYGGGLGWLISGDAYLSTHYDGSADSFERIYGAGYMRKIVKKGSLSADQLIFAPYGDDPVLISRVTIRNDTDQPVEVKWHEYWGSKPYSFSLRTLLYSLVGKEAELETYINNSAKTMRRELAKKYLRNYTIQGKTLRNRMEFKGWGFKDKALWGIAQKKYRPLAETAHNYSLYLGELDEQEDVNPPETFLYAADIAVESFITDAYAFFGDGGVGNPDGLYKTIKSKMKPSHSAMIAVSPATIPANGEITLTYIFGYVVEGFSREELERKYSSGFDKIYIGSCESWKRNRVSLTIPGQEWIDRELFWHNQSLRSALTYDSAFEEHILSQGHVYQYIMGFQGASRDPLQHVMPFLFTDPSIVREILRYTLKSMLPDGTVPYAMCGHGAIMISPFLSNDLEIWLLWTLCEYVLATKDISFLGEKVRPYPYKGEKQSEDTVLNLAIRGYSHFVAVGFGANNLPRILGGDWNDNVVVGNSDHNEQERIYEEGESVLIGAFAAAVLAKFADVLQMAGADASEVEMYARELRDAVAQQWNGKWFRRAYLGSSIGWVDEDILYLEPQPWAIMCGAADGERTKTLVSEIKEKNQDPSPIGAMLIHKTPDHHMKAPAGMATNGGVWPSITGTLIMALNKTDPAAAYEEWCKNTLAYHAEEYPKSWEGTWSGPDTYNSVLSRDPGRTFNIEDPIARSRRLSWIDFPVYNLHPHAWTLYNAASMFADSFTSEGAVFNLGFPENQFKFDSPLASLERSTSGFAGKYCPVVVGEWKIELTFFDHSREFQLEVNGAKASYERAKNGISFVGEGGKGSPLQWKIIFEE